MKALNYYCNQIADLIEQGYEADYAISKIQQQISSEKVNVKIDKILREFKYLYGHDVFYYSEKQPQITEIDNEELFYEFTSKNS